ncbi:MAG: GDSL-type esterase/lipase family protein [Bacteroidales bacterium]|nr:GDSL-type esterase/lipase family protein [Bacteroidales bacterium]
MKQFSLISRIILSVIILSVPCIQADASSKEKPKRARDKSLNILTLGDSNGALPFGWVNQLRQIRTTDTIFNISISGNTIGYNNNGRTSLNTLANIGNHMEKAYAGLGRIDRIIIMLGTNDCKAVFSDSLQFVPGNMKMMIDEIRKIAREHKDKPVIYIVSPPPFGPDDMLEEKYKGGMERVTQLNRKLEILAGDESVIFIDAFRILSPVFRQLTADGVHLSAEGQRMIALIIQENLKHQDRVSP